jgi:aspartyl-tRNA(Asn)/glutamyl-tRNA(Gln) amidotransferase subunit C
MKEIEISEIKKLASLSALEFSDEELEKFKTEFESILELVDIIQNCDTSDVKQIFKSHKFEELREDVVQPSLPQDVALLNSPKTRKGAFAVLQVLEED